MTEPATPKSPTRRTLLLATVLPLLLAAAIGLPVLLRASKERRSSEFQAYCLTARDAEDWEELERIAGEWVAWDPTSTSGWLFFAEAAESRNDLAAVAERLGRVDDSDERARAALWQRVELLFGPLGRPVEAVETCRRILAIDPRLHPPMQRILFFHAITLRPRPLIDALQTYLPRLAGRREAIAYRLLASNLEFTNGYHVVSEWLEGSPDSEPLLVARSLYASRSGAREVLGDAFGVSANEVTDRFPNNPQWLAHRLEAAIDGSDVDRVEELLPAPSGASNSSIERARGWYHARRGDVDRSLEAYERALALDPYDWRARHAYSTSLRRAGRGEDAVRASTLALEGKDIERALKELPNAAEVDDATLTRIRAYAERLGDDVVVGSVDRALTR